MKRIAFVVVACLMLVACGKSGLNGTYVAKGGGMGNGLIMEKLVFDGSDQVTVTMMEQTFRVGYKLDGKQLLLNYNGTQVVFNVDDGGCLDGGNLYGKFCKA